MSTASDTPSRARSGSGMLIRSLAVDLVARDRGKHVRNHGSEGRRLEYIIQPLYFEP